MATSLSEIYDFFMQNVTDYRLIDLFNTSQDDFENYLQAWLESAVVEFEPYCDQDINFNGTTKLFPVDLNRDNKVILAMLMTKYWLQKVVNDITQMNLHVTDRDFKIASEAQNLREKVSYLNTLKEDCSQKLIDYGYRKNSWEDWFSQEFKGV
jgi:hypothetical protein